MNTFESIRTRKMHDAIARARGSDTNRHVNVDHLRGNVRERQVGDDVLFALTKVITDGFERGLWRPCGIVVRDHHRCSERNNPNVLKISDVRGIIRYLPFGLPVVPEV